MSHLGKIRNVARKIVLSSAKNTVSRLGTDHAIYQTFFSKVKPVKKNTESSIKTSIFDEEYFDYMNKIDTCEKQWMDHMSIEFARK
jgi:hypothetical protein